MKKKIIAGILCMILLTGCGRINFTTILKNDEVCKIGKEICTLSEARLLLAIEKNAYEKRFGEEVWTQDFAGEEFEKFIKDNILNDLMAITAHYLFALDEKIKLTEDEKSRINQKAERIYESMTVMQRENLEIDIASIQHLLEKQFLAQKIYEEKTGSVESEISDVDAKVIHVQHIFIKTFNVDGEGKYISYDSDAFLAAKASAANVREKAIAGEDFMELSEKYSDDPIAEYIFSRNEMEKSFADAAFLLSDGEVSEIVETKKGFHIIKCVSRYLREESVQKKEELIAEEKSKKIEKSYRNFVENLNITMNSRLWDKLSIAGIEKININLFDFYDINSSQ